MFITKKVLLFLIVILTIDSYGQTKDFKVILDAGHGGHDNGANYHGRKEKNIALAVVLKVGKILESYSNVDVIYTRKTDKFITLKERAKIANRAKANLFISIHCNANKNSAANGSETYVMGMSRTNINLEVSKAENSVIFLEDNYEKAYKGFDPNNPETLIGLKMTQENNLTNSIDLAYKIQKNFSNTSRIKSRGVKQEPLWVLDASVMPGVLIETGFISNPSEGKILNSKDGQNTISRAIANAIISYKKEYFEDGVVETLDEKSVKSSKTTEANKGIKKKDTIGSIYKIQFAASKKKLALEPKNFKGLRNVTLVYEDNIYKYFYGETSDYEKAKSQLNEVKSKGYDSAFLITYKSEKK